MVLVEIQKNKFWNVQRFHSKNKDKKLMDSDGITCWLGTILRCSLWIPSDQSFSDMHIQYNIHTEYSIFIWAFYFRNKNVLKSRVLAILVKLVNVLKLGLRSISKRITSLILVNIYTRVQHALAHIILFDLK